MSYYQHPAYTAGTASQYAENQTAYYGYDQNTQNQYLTDGGYYAGSYPVQQAQPNGPAAWFNFSNGTYLKGFLIGAALGVVVANPTVQKAIVRGAVKVWTGLQGGVEEIKEHVKDIKAEMSQK